jgi:protein-S-isoprenylcysteine O-methyltransferase Ste14
MERMRSSWVIFAAGSALFVWFSWTISIRARRFHGLARFFAFESILALLLLNARVWFHESGSALHILAWVFLGGSLVLAAWSISIYFRFAAPRGEFENSTRLVENGIYRFIRHPMYGSLMFLGLGIYFKRITALTSILAFIVVLALFLTALIEEGEMRARFGENYAAYRRRTRMFIPFLF